MRITETANQARLEDLTWMTQHGENATGAAARLGISETSLERWCRRHHLHPLWQTLRNRNPATLPSPTSRPPQDVAA